MGATGHGGRMADRLRPCARRRPGARLAIGARLLPAKAKEAHAIASFADVAPYRLRDLRRDWWRDVPDDRHTALFHRFVNYRRLAGLLGRYDGHRRGIRKMTNQRQATG